MPFTTGKTDITPRRGTDSYIIAFEQEGWDKPDASGIWPSYDGREAAIDSEAGGHLRPAPEQPQASSIGIMREGTTIDASYFKGTPIHSKDGEGPATVTGDLVFNISGNGTGQIFRSILQDKNPVATRVNSITETSILANTAVSGNTASTTFANNVSGNFAPAQITATLSGSPALSSGQDSGTIEITGTNRWGGTEIADLTWTRSELANNVFTKTTQVFFTSITSAQPDDSFSAGMYKLDYEKVPSVNVVAANTSLTSTNITVANASLGSTAQPVYVSPTSAAMASTTLFGYVSVTGTDNNGRTITDDIRYINNTADLARRKKSTFFFRTITRVTVSGFSAGTFRLDSADNAQNVIFTPSTELVSFLTLEVGKGNKPDTYRNVIYNSTSINFARTEPVRATISVLGGQADLGLTGTGGTSATDRSKLNYTSEDVFSGWECIARAGNTEFAARSITWTVNHNLSESDLLGGKYPSAPPSGAGEREVILTIELQTDDENDFRDLYDSNISLNDVSIQLTNLSHGAYPHQVIAEFPTMQITEDPDFVVDDFDIIGQTLSLRAIYTPGLDYEFRIRTQYSEWFPVRIYT